MGDNAAFSTKGPPGCAGVRLDSTGSTNVSISTKLAAAKRGVCANLEAWRNKGSRSAKIEAFARQVHARVLHGSRTWVLTDNLLHLLRRWENEVVSIILGIRRLMLPGKELETPWACKTRAGKEIATLYDKLGIMPIWLKALRSIFREAWRNRTNGCLPANPLNGLRDWRSRVWWAGIEDIPANKRQQGINKHRRTGPVRLWEDVLVEACGIHWRDKRTACATKQEWDLIAAAAIRQLTYKYKLPHAPASKAEARLHKPKDPNPTTPILALTQFDLNTKPGLVLVVDCKPLSRVLNGLEALGNDGLVPLCTRVTDKLISLETFWNQLYSSPHWITWRPRHLNQIADAAANQVMDSSEDFEVWSDPLPSPDILRATKVIGFSDGGLRSTSSKASIGWVIVAINDMGEWLLGKGGMAVEGGQAGSFSVEAIGLEVLVDKF